MPDKTGFIVKVRSAGKEYFYLRKNHRILKEPGKPKVSQNKNIYPLGTKIKALENLQKWIDEPSKAPEVIKENGYSMEDFKKWKEKITS